MPSPVLGCPEGVRSWNAPVSSLDDGSRGVGPGYEFVILGRFLLVPRDVSGATVRLFHCTMPFATGFGPPIGFPDMRIPPFSPGDQYFPGTGLSEGLRHRPVVVWEE